ncbi:phage tail assembly chaperone [Lysinibacillus sp. 54212]|uniref:phage tail assembly chaperone n=1 Tax=Lysinibacillus sp. 54212 TaxID=3119829 RepID=UPI002FC88613
MSKFLSLEDVLGADAGDLQKLKQDAISCEKLKADIPVTALENKEYKTIKKDCMQFVPDGTGGMKPDIDDDKLMIRVIIAAADKDTRSDFSFANKQLLDKLAVTTADQAVEKLLSPGEIFNAAMVVQDISGFGKKAKKAVEAEVKNS